VPTALRASDSADADHSDVRAFKRGERRRAVQTRDAAEAPRAVGGFIPVEAGSKIGLRGGAGHDGRARWSGKTRSGDAKAYVTSYSA
jgi:hypothetical protein